MKKIFFLIAFIISISAGAQVYQPNLHTTTNKGIGVAQAAPTDARSMFYDANNFVYRPYVSTTEVLSYLSLPKYRTGGFDIIVNTGGTLGGNGVIAGGANAVYWFKDGTADTNLVLKNITSGTAVDTLPLSQRITQVSDAKVDKEDGKGLSTEDFTTSEKATLVNAATHITNLSNPHQVTTSQIGAPTLATLSELRSMTLDPNMTYQTPDGGLWRVDATDNSSTDNTGTVVVNGSTRVRRVFDGPVYPEWFGALGDSSNNDNTALNAAIATGKDVYLRPNKVYIITSLSGFSNYQRIYGGGKIVGSATATISITSKTGVTIEGIKIQAAGTTAASGVALTTSSDINVVECSISNFGAAGVISNGGTRINVLKNIFTGAVNNVTFGYPSAQDVNLNGSNTSCVIKGNICISGGGYAIHIRTTNSGEHSDNHLVTENYIDGYNSYGILLYRTGTENITQSISNCIISKNVVKNISGIRPADPEAPSDLTFGAGIYDQGGENATINENKIYSTCINTNDELLAPGGIGFVSVGWATANLNTIEDSRQYGIYVNDANNNGDTSGTISLNGNNINKAVKSGIKINIRKNVSVLGGGIRNVEHGIIVANGGSAIRGGYHFSNVTIKSCTNSGINLSYANVVNIEGNIIDSLGVHGITSANSSNLIITGNRVRNAASRGIEIASTNSGTNSVLNNVVTNCAVGLLANANAVYLGNIFEANTTNVSGTNIDLVDVSASTTPDVKHRATISLAPSSATTFTDFQNGVLGQRLVIYAGTANVTIQNNSNIALFGAANYTMANGDVLTLLRTDTKWTEVSRSAIGSSQFVRGIQALGSSIKVQPIGNDLTDIATSGGLTDGRINFMAVYNPTYQTFTGVKFFLGTTGDYTADNENRIGLYSYSGGTLTLVASSANDGNLYKGSANSLITVAFSTPYVAAPGVYYVAFIYNNSAQVTSPTIGLGANMANAALSAADLGNSAKLYCNVGSQTALPSSQAMSGTSTTVNKFWFGLY